MTLIKTSLLSSIAVGVKVCSTVALNKILALHVGPNGYAAIGQFQNFVNMTTSLAGGAANVGVTKFTAEFFDDEEKQIRYWKTAGTATIVGSILAGAVIIGNSGGFAELILKDSQYSGLFSWLGVSVILFALNGLLLSILNGKKEVGRYVIANISGSLCGLIVTGALAFWGGLHGALLALAINQSFVLGCTLVLCSGTHWFRFRSIFGRVDPQALRSLGKYALMTVTSAVCLPVSQMVIRNHLAVSFGFEATGHWEALMRISGLYVMLITTPLALYYLPRLAEISSGQELRREILDGYRVILPLAVSISGLMYLLRDQIVAALFSRSFLPMVDLFSWQMAGDSVKVGSWLLGYVLIARGRVRSVVVTEVIFAGSWIALVFVFTSCFGKRGAQMAYLTNYLLHWAVMSVLVTNMIRNEKLSKGE
jgi:polysaccharide transporter, PST family